MRTADVDLSGPAQSTPSSVRPRHVPLRSLVSTMQTGPTPARTAITDVRVFDGSTLSHERTVVLDGGLITASTSTADAQVVAGHGGTLLPGLIDAHVHLHGTEQQEQAVRWGVTTMLDMGTSSPQLLATLRGRSGVSDIRSSGSPASAPGSMQTTRMGFPASTALTGPADAERFVADRVAEGVDHVKVIVEDPVTRPDVALDRPTIAALVGAAHERGLRVVAHVTTVASIRLATQAGVDVLTHAPLDATVTVELVDRIAAAGLAAVPTLTMMRAVSGLPRPAPSGPGPDFGHACAFVLALHRAGVPVVAGTDANAAPGSPAPVAHGAALHQELDLLVAAGLTPVEALRAATSVAAEQFGLPDRGVVQAGRRADLLLVDGDPTLDVRATAKVRAVWVGGVRAR